MQGHNGGWNFGAAGVDSCFRGFEPTASALTDYRGICLRGSWDWEP